MIPRSNEIRIEVTTRCNYNCIICPRDKLTRPLETMSDDLFKKILDKLKKEAPQYDILSFPGMGEPLLDRNLENKIEYAHQYGFKVLILTNGSLLTPERFSRFEEIGVDSIRVSMYGNTKESYLSIHGIKDESLFEKVKNNLVEICQQKKTTKLILTYNIVNDINDGCLESWIEFWKDRVDLLEVWRPHNWVTGRQYRKVQGKKLPTCGRPFNTPLQIQVDGTINMCCFDFDGKLLLGDLKTQSLEEIFQSTAFMKIAECHNSGDYSNSGLICEHCDQRNADKSDVMVYNSVYNIKERVNQVSTTYNKVL